MKKMRNRIITLILVISMLFAIMAPTVISAEGTAGVGGTGGGTNTGSSTDSSNVGGTLDTGWCKIEYDDNNLTVTLYPDVQSLLDVSKEQIKEMASTLIDAVKTIAFDEIKEGILDDLYGTETYSSTEDINIDNLWRVALDNFIEEEFGAGESAEDAYLTFVKKAVEDGSTVVDDFTDYVCGLIRTVVKAGVIKAEELPEADDALTDRILGMLEDKMNEVIDSNIKKYLAEYVKWITVADGYEDKAKPDIPDAVIDFIATELSGYVTAFANKYVDNKGQDFAGMSEADKVFFDYIEREIKEYVGDVSDKYLALERENLTTEEQMFFDYVDGKIEAYIKDTVEKYLSDDPADKVGLTAEEQKFFDFADKEIEAYVGDIVEKYLSDDPADKVGLTAEEQKFFDYVDAEIEAYVGDVVEKYLANDRDNLTTEEQEFFDYVDGKVVEYARAIADKYVDNAEEPTDEERPYFDYIDREILAFIKRIEENYIGNIGASTPNEQTLYEYVDKEFHKFVEKQIDHFIAVHQGTGDGSQLHTEMDDLIEEEFNRTVGEAFENYFKYRKGELIEKPMFFDEIDLEIRTRITTRITDAVVAEFVAAGKNPAEYQAEIAAEVQTRATAEYADIDAVSDEYRDNKTAYTEELFAILVDEYENNPADHTRIVDNLVTSIKASHTDILREQADIYVKMDTILGIPELKEIVKEEIYTYLDAEKILSIADTEVQELISNKVNGYLDADTILNIEDADIKGVIEDKVNKYLKAEEILAIEDQGVKDAVKAKINEYIDAERVLGIADVYTVVESKVNEYLADLEVSDIFAIDDVESAIRTKVNEVLTADNAIPTAREILAELKVSSDPVDKDTYDAICEEINGKIDEYVYELDAQGNVQYEDGYPVYKASLLDKAVATVLEDDTYTKARLDDFIADAVDYLVEEYRLTREELLSIDPTLSIKDIITYIDGVTVNGKLIYGEFGNGYTELNTDAIIELLRELPTPTELENMANEDMQLSYSVLIETDFADCDFVLTAKVGGGYDKIRTLARLFNDYITVGRAAGNTLVVDVDVPAKFSELVLKACKTGKLSDELKNKIFKALSSDVNDAYALYGDFTFAEIIELLEKVNFEGIFDKDFVSRYVDLSHLSNEEIIEKVAEYERYYNTFNRYLAKVLNRVPEEYKTKTLLDFYKGDGLFGLAESRTVNIEDTLTKISEKYGPLVASYLDKETITAGFDVEVNFEKINRIEYVVAGDTVREGFLPAGADVTFFAGQSDYNGTAIVAWVNYDTGTVVTEMPDEDVTLVALLDRSFEIASSEDVEFEYDGTERTVKVVVSELMARRDVVNYVFEWYKDGVLLPDKTEAEFKVKNVSDSGVYKCIVTVTAEGGLITKTLESDEIEVTITPIELNASSLSWNYTAPFTYDKTEKSVALSGTLPEGFKVDYTNDKKTDAYTYTATATVTALDTNHKVTGAVRDLEWTINPIVLNTNTLTWSYNNTPFEYDGSEKSVYITNLPAEGFNVVYTNDKKTDADDYTATATVTASSTNYKVEGGVISLDWKIAQVVFDVTRLTWSYTTPFTYNGSTHTVALTNQNIVPGGFTLTYGGVRSATDADTYTATATVTANNSNYAVIGGGVSTCTWTINPITLNVSGFTWNYAPAQPFTYDGTEKSVLLTNTIPEGFTASYTDNAKTLAGDYTAKVSITANNTNYKVEGSVQDLPWKIAKKTVTIIAPEWSFARVEYDGNEHTVFVKATSIPEGATVSYEGTVTASAKGNYTAKVIFAPINDNYQLSGTTEYEHHWAIYKDTIALPAGTGWNYTAPFTYSGNAYTVALVNEEALAALGIRAIYSGTYTATDAGTYTASVRFETNTPGLVVDGSVADLTWTINKCNIDLSTYSWSATDFTYNGLEQAVTVVDRFGVLTFTYTGNKATEVGTYTATATANLTDTANYTVSGEIPAHTWRINKIVIDLSGLSWNYVTDSLIYNGVEQKVELLGADTLPEGVTVEYSGNVATNAGNYTAVATVKYDEAIFSVANTAVFELDWQIKKATVDTSALALVDTSVIYDGQKHLIDLVGADTLPTGVTYTYDSQGYVYPGTYRITVKFNVGENYNPIADMSANLTITVKLNNVHGYYQNGVLVIQVNSEKGIGAEYDFVVSNDSHVYDGFYLENGQYAKVHAAYDIYFAKENAYQPMTDRFEVQMLVPAAVRDNTSLAILYIAEDGEVEYIEAARSGDYIKFNTTHFSTYAIIEITEPPVPPTEKDLTWLWILIAIVAVLLVVGIVVLIIVLKRRKKGDDPEDKGEAPIAPTDTPDNVEAAPVEEAPAEVVEEAPVEEAPAEVEEAPAEEAPVEVVEEAPAEEAPVEVVEEAPAEEAPAEVVEETPVVEEQVVTTVVTTEPVEFLPGEDKDGAKRAIVDGEIVMVRYRSSFQSRLIQSDEELQDYYTVIKNALLSYKGVKARASWNFESFNNGRTQCAKLNIKGKNLQVYLNLPSEEYSVSKYHFTDMGDKPKFDQVPLMMKVRSERALKYTLELIEDMMTKLEIPQGKVPEVDYHAPYETNDELVKKGLVKVILPAGMTLDENSNIVKVNVGEMLSTVKREDTPKTEPEAPAEVVEEAPVEETPAEVVEEAPVEELHLDAAHADELMTDTEAEESVVVVHTGANARKGKLNIINIDDICDNFEDGDVVTVDALKAKFLVPKNTARIKVLSRGIMTKKLTIIASKYSVQTIKMIDLAGGIAEVED